MNQDATIAERQSPTQERGGDSCPASCSASFRGVSIINADCMAVMSKLADKSYDLAICDPPYGIGAAGKKQYHAGALTEYTPKKWDDASPPAEYFDELRRVSKNQIIFGATYFTAHLPPAKNWIVWDKLQPEGVSFSMHELAYYSGGGQAKICRAYNGGNRVANNYEKAQKYIRIHPTQKPVTLYAWLLANYAQPGFRILDTHLGSGSSAIAALEYGYEMLATEIDEHYYAAAVERIGRAAQQETFAMTQNK